MIGEMREIQEWVIKGGEEAMDGGVTGGGGTTGGTVGSVCWA